MKQQVFYVHGGESYQDYGLFMERLKTKGIWDLPGTEQKGKWTEHLRADLGSDYEVFMPQMPNKQNAKYTEWKIWFERHFEHLHDGVILIGCSLGGMFLLRYCSEEVLPFSVKAMILMATPIKTADFNDEDCADFMCSLDMIPKLGEKVAKIAIWHSKDDFLVPYNHATELHKLLPTASLVTFEDKNHFLVPELPELVECIKELG